MRKLVLAIAAILASTLPVAAMSPATCRSEIEQVVGHMFTSGPMEVTAMLTSPAGDSKTETTIVPDVGLHTRTVLLPTTDVEEELLAMEGKVWHHTIAGWTRIPVSPLAYREIMGRTILGSIDEIYAPRCLGLVERDGHSYVAYGFSGPDDELKARAMLWVEPASGHTARIEFDFRIGNDATHVDAVFRYDPAITIVVPEGADLTNETITSIAPRR